VNFIKSVFAVPYSHSTGDHNKLVNLFWKLTFYFLITFSGADMPCSGPCSCMGHRACKPSQRV